jgi:glycogen debranching enzyme
MINSTGKPFDAPFQYVKDEHYINGINEYTVKLCEHIKLNESRIFQKTPVLDRQYTQLEFENFYPGSVVAVKYGLFFIYSFPYFTFFFYLK